MIFKDLQRFLLPIRRRIQLMIGRCVLKAINNSENTQKIQVVALNGENITDMERYQEYGFEAYPFAEAEALSTFINGNRDLGICICVHDKRYRPKDLSEGDVAVYTYQDKTSSDHRIQLKANKEIDILGDTINETAITINETATTINEIATTTNETTTTTNITASAFMNITAGAININGIISLATQAAVKALLNSNFATLYNGHTHDETGGVTKVPNQLAGGSHQTTNTKAS